MIIAKTIAKRIYDKCSECPYCKLNELANADICQISNEILTDCKIRHDKCPLREDVVVGKMFVHKDSMLETRTLDIPAILIKYKAEAYKHALDDDIMISLKKIVDVKNFHISMNNYFNPIGLIKILLKAIESVCTTNELDINEIIIQYLHMGNIDSWEGK